jgi:hypothetical protein
MKAIPLRKSLLAYVVKNREAYAVWTPFVFSAFLGLIVVVTHLSMSLSLKSPPTPVDAWLPVFFAFLPMTFFYACASQKQTRDEIKVLEARIEQLEADKSCS